MNLLNKHIKLEKNKIGGLVRGGMTRQQAETYIKTKAYNKAINSPIIANMRKNANKQQNMLERFLPSLTRMPQNIYHAKDIPFIQNTINSPVMRGVIEGLNKF